MRQLRAIIFLITVVSAAGITTVTAQGIPNEVKRDLFGRYLTEKSDSRGWSGIHLNQPDTLFSACDDGEYFVGFQLEHDLANENTSVAWSASLRVALMHLSDTLWVDTLSINGARQNFITTAFYNNSIVCDGRGKHRFVVTDTITDNPGLAAGAELKVMLYRKRDDFVRSASIALECSRLDSNNIHLSWNRVDNATEYDLEWVFIDALEGHVGSDPFALKEPAGITTSNKEYYHQAFYPKGELSYRIRAVGYAAEYPLHRIAGEWHGCSSSEPLLVLNRDSTTTWQAETVFTEDGKYKKVVKYFDPGMRQIQTLVNLSSDSMVVIGETMYDFEGRPSLNTLPVPVIGTNLKHRSYFSPFSPSAAVTGLVSSVRRKFNYDNGSRANSTVLGDITNAAHYYSNQNVPDSTADNYLWKRKNEFLPNANGYVYSQTEYMRDGRSIVSKQAGVGEAFSIDGDHATRYFYGQAGQDELSRLFGENVGNASHYKKHITVDNNGQVSVAYKDQEGRTIATALAGESPVPLDALTSDNPAADNTPSTLSVVISNKNKKEGKRSILTHKILNAVPNTTYTFNASLSAMSVDLGAKFGCNTCTYNLVITVTDPDGAIVTIFDDAANQAGTDVHSSYRRNSITTSGVCSTLTSVSNITFKFLAGEVGDYTLTKILTPVPTSYTDIKTKVLASTVVQELQTDLADAYANLPGDCEVCVDNPYCARVYEQIQEAIEETAEQECINLRNMLVLEWKQNPDHKGEPDDATLQTDLPNSSWCEYDLCKKNKASEVFDRQMSRVPTWEAAQASGYHEPLKKDPFFTTGLSGELYAGNMRTAFLDHIKVKPDEVNFLDGTIERICDPDAKEFFVNEYGVSDRTNGKHVLYFDVMSRKDAIVSRIGIAGFNKKIDTMRWVYFRNFYMDAKRKQKLNTSDYDNCARAETKLEKLNLPTTDAGIKTYIENNWVQEPELDSLADGLASCAGLPAKKSFIKSKLRGYFGANTKNFLHLILSEDTPAKNPFIKSIDSLVGSSCVNLFKRSNPYPITCDSSVLVAKKPHNLIVNPTINKTSTSIGCTFSGAVISSSCYSGWQSVSGQASAKSGELLLRAKDCANISDAIYGTFSETLKSGHYRLSFEYRLAESAYRGGPYVSGAENFIQIQLADNTDTFFPTTYYPDNLHEKCVTGYIETPPQFRRPGATGWEQELFEINNTTTTYQSASAVFELTGLTTATKFYISVSTPVNSMSGAVLRNFKLEKLDEVCVRYHEISPFDYQVNWDSVIAKCVASDLLKKQAIIDLAVDKFVETQMTEFDSLYNCLDRTWESASYSYNSREYHYTLYYYDQAGNLVQTVPPKGVRFPEALPDSPGFPDPDVPRAERLSHISTYKYNSFNQVVMQNTPDAGITDFWYDRKSQLRLSRNSQQLQDSTYAYTKYDSVGRVTEVGLMYSAILERNGVQSAVEDSNFPYTTDTLTNITWTFYDSPAAGLTDFRQDNLRNRVSYTEVTDGQGTAGDAANIKTYFSYDIHGNVKSLRQKIPGLWAKDIHYVYDLISNKVNYVFYQYDSSDQFVHHYTYDADNRIKSIETSTDRFIWNHEAEYDYYAHGPLARIELGEHSVQGQDYFYTLQGWLKGVNMPYKGDPNDDGNDGSKVGKDVMAFTLGYFAGDYEPIKGSKANNYVLSGDTTSLWHRWQKQFSVDPEHVAGLFNGNISWMVTDVAKQGDLQSDRRKGMQAMVYKYDQLNRITQSRSLTSYNGSNFEPRGSASLAYDETFSYDPNGNLLSLQRWDKLGALKDDFNYKYYGGTNKLYEIHPLTGDLEISSGSLTTDHVVYKNITLEGTASVDAESDVEVRALEDIKLGSGFTAANDSKFYGRKMLTGATYEYDSIGNLIRDNEKGVAISWTPQGKVRSVDMGAGASVTTFRYDAMGNRVEKKIVRGDTVTITRYLRDASGNVMGVYNDTTMIEQPIYGSSRLGQYRGGGEDGKSILGLRRYELSNHLGNVLSVISDKIYMHDDTVKAFVVSTSDYYPFGLAMEGRTWSDTTTNYRYGFNGKEKDTSEWGSTAYDYGFRIYDPSIGRFLSIDPLQELYPFSSPYAHVLNNPIKLLDPDGQYVQGDKTTQLDAFVRVLMAWEIIAERFRKSTIIGKAGTEMRYESENHAKIRIFDSDFRAKDQLITEIEGSKKFSYSKSFGKYLDVGLPLDVAHFFKMANLSQDYPDAVVRHAYVKEEFKQAKDSRDGGRTSSFAPEDLFSNELGVIFGDGLDKKASFSKEFQKFMGEVKTLFTTNELSNGTYLTPDKVDELRGIANKYYGTTDLRTFKKDSDIYKIENIKTINNNAFHENYPFYNNPKNSEAPKPGELKDYTKATSDK